MNEYEKIALNTRKKVSELTLEQQNELSKLFRNTTNSLSKAIGEEKTLSNRWMIDYKKQLELANNELRRDIYRQTKESVKKAAVIGTEAEQLILTEVFKIAGIDTGNHFTNMFSQVQDKVIKDIISGNLYKDNKTLSSRIWDTSDKFKKDIQYMVNRAILEKKSAISLARDLEKFVLDPAKREWDWQNVYPYLRNTPVDYNAMRLARTSINHAYQNSSIQSSSMNPFVEGIQWRSAQIHGRTCELCIERATTDQFGLGIGIFPIDQVPLDHPNGLCTMIPHISKDLDTVATELRNWIDGGSNEVLDKWYNEYGDYFAFKKL